MCTIDAASIPSDACDEDDAAPVSGLHRWNGELAKKEGCAQVDAEGGVEFGEGDVVDMGDAFAVAGVGDEDIGVVAMFSLNFLEESFDVRV